MKKSIRPCRLAALAAVFALLALPTGSSSNQQGMEAFAEGEAFRYSVFKLLLKVGSVNLTYNGVKVVNSRELVHISFKATGLNFSDTDDIYLDPQTYFPVEVVRDINFFGSHEKIIERYNPEEGSVTIEKSVKDKTEIQTITKDGPLENIYAFIYRFRINNSLNIGDKVRIRLPTQDVVMSYVDQREFSWRGKKHRVAYLESEPKQFRIWFDIESGMVPLRIDGAVGFGSTAMILSDYNRP